MEGKRAHAHGSLVARSTDAAVPPPQPRPLLMLSWRMRCAGEEGGSAFARARPPPPASGGLARDFGRASALLILLSERASRSNPGGRTDDVPSRSSTSPTEGCSRRRRCISDPRHISSRNKDTLHDGSFRRGHKVVRSFALPDPPSQKGTSPPTSSSLHILHACQPRVRCIHCDAAAAAAVVPAC